MREAEDQIAKTKTTRSSGVLFGGVLRYRLHTGVSQKSSVRDTTAPLFFPRAGTRELP